MGSQLKDAEERLAQLQEAHRDAEGAKSLAQKRYETAMVEKDKAEAALKAAEDECVKAEEEAAEKERAEAARKAAAEEKAAEEAAEKERAEAARKAAEEKAAEEAAEKERAEAARKAAEDDKAAEEAAEKERAEAARKAAEDDKAEREKKEAALAAAVERSRTAAPAATVGMLQGLFCGEYAHPGRNWKHCRMITDAEGLTSGDNITVIGSDDGQYFFKTTGKFTDKSQGKLTMDLSYKPKGGTAVEVEFENGKLLFLGDGKNKSWQQLDAVGLPEGGHGVENLQGVFMDPKHYEAGTLKGLRMVTDAEGKKPGNNITIIGTDNGNSFWKVMGAFTDKDAGKVSIDFSPKGGPAGITATWVWQENLFKFDDGNNWERK